MKGAYKVLAIVVILLSASVSAAFIADSSNKSSEKTVYNEGMDVLGLEKDGVVTYKGIPYAEAPVGDLRFAPPVKKEQWTDTLDCTQWGNIAFQQSFTSTGSAEHGDNENEDCLNLNIWAPADAKAGDKLPVYVWIHGGAYISGSGQDLTYDGTNFAKEGVIVVTINYRLGVLGFLSLGSLKDDNSLGTTGNWGTLDQIMALQWVQDNIGKFGGDKDNVTIGGQSAGSFSVLNMIVSPLAEGLFQKAILESGAIMHIFEASKSYDDDVAVSQKIAEKLGADDSEEGIKKLRSLTASEITDAAIFTRYMTDDHSYSVWPAGDDVVIPEDFISAVENGEYNTDIEIIIGYNYTEGIFFTKDGVTEDEFNYLIDCSFSEIDAVKVKEYYEKTELTLQQKDSELTGMLMIKLGVERMQKLFGANEDTTVYAYQFMHSLEFTVPPVHGLEVEFAFGQDTLLGSPFEGNDKIIRDIMHGYWLNFIKSGDPNGDGLAVWEQYSPTEDSLMTFKVNTSEMSDRADKSEVDTLNQWYLP